MSEYTQEQYDQLPDFMQKDLQKVGDTYKHGEAVVLKDSLNNLDSKYKGVESQLSETKGQLTQFQEQEAAKIEEAKKKALEDARTNGDVKAIEERYQQKMEDLEKRTADRVRGEVTTEFEQKS